MYSKYFKEEIFMKKVSKVISILLVAIMTLSVFAVSVSAVATPLVAGNTKETATNIPCYDTEYVSELSKAGETDWFKFTTLTQDAYYTISLENYNIFERAGNESYALNMFIYDTYNEQIAQVSRKNSTNVKLEKNTIYYIKVCTGKRVWDSTGNYEVLVSYKLDSVSNIKEEATVVSINKTYNNSLDGTGDIDWFSFTVPNDGTYKVVFENYDIYELVGNENYVSNLFIYNKYNKQIVNIQRTNSMEVELEKDATYYIKVAMGYKVADSTGNYSFSVNYDSVPEPDNPTLPDNPNDNSDNTDFDFMAILTAIWNFFVGIFNFFIGLFA